MENIRITFFDAKDYDRNSFNRAVEGKNVVIDYFETRLSKDTVSLAAGHEVVCVFVNDTLDSFVISELVKCGVKLIALRCAGYNNVDIEYAFGKIHIVRVPAYSPYAVAEHAISLLLTLNRKIHRAYIRTRDFNFSLSGLTGFDLHGKTVGVIGTGKIGRIFIDICRGFGMNVIAYDKFPVKDSDIKYVELEELFRDADIISLHCPLTEENRHMIDGKAIGQMKDNVVIINTSRGALVDTEALVEGIKDKKIGGAGLDVYEEESDVFFHDFSGTVVNDDTLARLISMPNVIVTSHQAFLTNEALTNIADTTLQNIEDFFENEYSANEVCYKCDKLGQCPQAHSGKCF